MSDQQTQLPVYILTWSMPARGRGRRHTGIHIPNADSVQNDPVHGPDCKGTFYHVQGAPMTGFELQIKRNWDSVTEATLERALRIAWIDQGHVWIPTTADCMINDLVRRCDVDRLALATDTPRISTRLWIAVGDILSSSELL